MSPLGQLPSFVPVALLLAALVSLETDACRCAPRQDVDRAREGHAALARALDSAFPHAQLRGRPHADGVHR
jgi:hypothetical protein